jgi:hypothetical protein
MAVFPVSTDLFLRQFEIGRKDAIKLALCSRKGEFRALPIAMG